MPSKKEKEDFGIEDFIDFFSILLDISGLQVDLEGILGVGLGTRIALGEGVGAKVAVDGMAQLTYQGRLFDRGTLTNLASNDALRGSLAEINRILALKSSNNRVGIKTLLKILSS